MSAQKIKWTPSQTDAINARADKILVSAAAGSGKSTVLTERIISSLTSPDRVSDVSRLLVVTFTRAAAEELKIKIGNALRSASSAEPTNKHLAEQLIKLPSSHISTIHGLCLTLIKNNFTALGLSASVRVGDETEIATLRTETMDQLLEDAFSGYFAPIPDFSSFSDNFISDRDDRLSEIFISLYKQIKNHPDGFESWEHSIGFLNSGTLSPDGPFTELLCRRVEIFTDYAMKLYSAALDYFDSDEKYSASAGDLFREHSLFLSRLHDLSVKCDYFAIREFLPTFSGGRLGQLKADSKTNEGEYYRIDVRTYVAKKISELRDKYFCFSEDDISYLGSCNAKISRALFELLREFDRRFTAEKQARSLLDYSDLEHYTLHLLYSSDGTLTDVAKQLSASFDEIYVDEYQDVNPLQNKIFEALSCQTPIFMVGDIKQSIYSFRGAMPSIFAQYRRTFSDFPKQGENDRNVRIFLSENFRSERPVTEFANVVSDAIFNTPEDSPCFEYRIPYSKSDRLVCSKPPDVGTDVTILIASSEKADEEDDSVDRVRGTDVCLEAEMVAGKIKELTESGVDPSEIAILLRSTKYLAPKFESALRERGVSVTADRGSSLFDAPEIQLSICLLNCIDNPYRDIFLAGALKSPVFAITLDELITIKREKKDASLYEALTEYTYTHDFPKGRRFLSFLERMRSFAISNPVDRVLWQMYTETSLFSVIQDSDDISQSTVSRRRSNLLQLHTMASDFTVSGKTDLYSFVEQLRLISEGTNIPPGASDEGKGVRIMSIHQSKGLEFSYCFLCGTGHAINREDIRKPLIFHPEYGLTLKIKDELRLSSSESPYRLALASLTELTQTDEEMRILYVALTRAKSVLYICAEMKDHEKTELLCHMNARTIHPMTFISKNSYIQWILTALQMKTDLSPRYRTVIMSEAEINASSPETYHKPDTPRKANFTKGEPEYDRLYSMLSERLSYKYPHARSAQLPAKLSVSKLYPGVLDSDISDPVLDFDGSDLPFICSSENSDVPDNGSKLSVPLFMSDVITHDSSERGTATHVFMQFCDFSMLESTGVRAEINRLKEKRFITPQMAELVNTKHIEGFLRSDIYREMKSAEYLQREYRFNIKLPAEDFTSDPGLKSELRDDHIFVQGVIDCYFRSPDGRTVLLDYKTDRVPKDIFGNTTLEDELFKSRYSRQLGYYETALNKLTGRDVDEVIIYSFSLGRTIKLK